MTSNVQSMSVVSNIKKPVSVPPSNSNIKRVTTTTAAPKKDAPPSVPVTTSKTTIPRASVSQSVTSLPKKDISTTKIPNDVTALTERVKFLEDRIEQITNVRTDNTKDALMFVKMYEARLRNIEQALSL
jgi:hypothetical protein